MWHILLPVLAYAPRVAPQQPSRPTSHHGRRQFLLSAGAAVASLLQRPAWASSVGGGDAGDKLLNLPADRLADIVRADLVERQFLATADFTRAVYDEGALFTDEIDTYTLPKFIKGTSALFVKDKSEVRLVGEVKADDREVVFYFDEDLCFNIPLQPVVTVTGRCVLSRDPSSGLIVKYREYWDKSPTEVLKTAFNRPRKAAA